MKKSTVLIASLVFSFVIPAIALAAKNNNKSKSFFPTVTCPNNPKLQQVRSRELQQLVKADQKCRMNQNGEMADLSKLDWAKITKQDLARRKRVGEIFAEGCINSMADYKAAALIYQHGDVPDHYYQTYIWAMRAAELGDKNAKSLVALAIDRYLINIGHKQLFGSQCSADDYQKDPCYCMSQVETSFPDYLRKEYLGQSLKEYSRDHFALFNQGKNCPNIECSKSLKPSPKGIVPGLW